MYSKRQEKENIEKERDIKLGKKVHTNTNTYTEGAGAALHKWGTIAAVLARSSSSSSTLHTHTSAARKAINLIDR